MLKILATLSLTTVSVLSFAQALVTPAIEVSHIAVMPTMEVPHIALMVSPAGEMKYVAMSSPVKMQASPTSPWSFCFMYDFQGKHMDAVAVNDTFPITSRGKPTGISACTFLGTTLDKDGKFTGGIGLNWEHNFVDQFRFQAGAGFKGEITGNFGVVVWAGISRRF